MESVKDTLRLITSPQVMDTSSNNQSFDLGYQVSEIDSYNYIISQLSISQVILYLNSPYHKGKNDPAYDIRILHPRRLDQRVSTQHV